MPNATPSSIQATRVTSHLLASEQLLVLQQYAPQRMLSTRLRCTQPVAPLAHAEVLEGTCLYQRLHCPVWTVFTRF